MALAHPFFLLLLLALPTQSASVYTPALQQAHQETLRLRIPAARHLVQQELLQNPDNAVALLLANQQDFLTWAIQQNSSQYATLLSRQENRYKQLAGIADASPWRDFAMAEAKLYIAISKLLKGYKLSAAWDVRQAYLHYTANAKKHPDFLPNKKSLGALQVLIGSVPDSYRVLLNIIGMQGSIAQGMANLAAAATKTNPFQEEARVLHALLRHLVHPQADQEAADALLQMNNRAPDNLLYTFVAMHVLKKTKQSEKALQLYLQRPTQAGYLAFPFLHHMAADLYLYKSDFATSVQLNQLFLAQHQGEHYLKAAHFKLYLAHYLNGTTAQADKHLEHVRQLGQAEVDEDAYASRFAKEAVHPNRYLLQSRLQSDGGYHARALVTLQQMPLHQATQPADRAEYYYRKARIYHGLKQPHQAKDFYKRAIEASHNTTLYFAPYAALQLGYLYQEESKPRLAREWFGRARSYKGHDYKNSIDGKAKLALQTLKKN